MYGRYPASYPKGGDDTHVHVHAPPPTKDQQIGMSGLIIALIAILAIIVVSIMVYKNQNAVATTATTTAATTSNVAVPMSSTTSTGFVDTVVVGSAASIPGQYLDTANYDFATPPVTLASTPSAGSYGWYSYVGAIDFTAGYWLVNINNLISIDQTSAYIANAYLSNLSNYQLYLCIDPNSTTIPGTSTPYSFATDGPYVINGGSIVSSSGTLSQILTSSTIASLGIGGNNVSTQYSFANGGSLGMPPLITYVNVPSDITYYIMGCFLFSLNTTGDTAAASDCPMLANLGWNATRLSNPIPEATLPYSSYFAPATATTTGSGGAAATTSYKAGFYGGGNVYGQYY